MKKYIILVLIVLLIGALFVGVVAAPKVAHLYLYEKDADWEIVDPGAWGKMKYSTEGAEFEFVFNGHGLEPGEDYALIYFEDPSENPWTTLPTIFVFGKGSANGGGEVHIAGSIDTEESLPYDADVNDGAKIWLVLSDNCDVDVMQTTWTGGWYPEKYLFEGSQINFTYIED